MKLDSILIEETYAGIYAGDPSREDMYSRARNRLKTVFGPDRPVVLIEPSPFVGQGQYLPRYVHIAWFSEPTPGRESPDGYHFFVIRYSNEPIIAEEALLAGIDVETCKVPFDL